MTTEYATYIQEAQRRIARDLLQTPLMTAKGLAQWQDSCHYPYVGGYQELGNRMSNLLLAEEYGDTTRQNVTAPSISSFTQIGNNVLELQTSDMQDTLIWQPGVEEAFVLTDSLFNTIMFADSGWTSNNLIYLSFDQPIPLNAPRLSHLDIQGAGVDSPYVVNSVV